MKSTLQLPIVQALIWTFLSTICFTFITVLIKFTGSQVSIFILMFFRNFFGLVFLLPEIIRQRTNFFEIKNTKLHISRSFLALLSMFFWYSAVAQMPLADATTISFTVPIFATIGAIFVFGEKVKLRRWSAMIVGFVGIFIILQPRFVQLDIYTLYCFIYAIIMAFSVLVIKALSMQETALRVVGWPLIYMTPISLVIMIPFWEPISLTILLALAAFGILAAIAHIFATKAFAIADISLLAPLDYMRLPLVAILGYFLFNETTTSELWLGSLLIFLSTWYISYREYQLKKKRDWEKVNELKG